MLLDALQTLRAKLRAAAPKPAPPDAAPTHVVEPAPRRANPQVRRGTPPAKPTPPSAPQSWPLLYLVGGTRGGVNINNEFWDSSATRNWRIQNGR
jgi:hypothetical protein